jgi:hypothetical protein
MSRRKEPAMLNDLRDRLLAGGVTSDSFAQGGLLA